MARRRKAASAARHPQAGKAVEAGAEKKDVLKRERTLTDDIMTVIFLAEIALVFYHVHDDRTWLAILIGALAGVSVVIYLSKRTAAAFGWWLSETVLNTSWTPFEDRRPLLKRQTMKKFTDQSWQLVIHASMAIVEYWLVFVDTPGAPEQNFFDNTSLCWFAPGEQVHSTSMEVFYVVQLSIWIVTCFSHRFVEARHKDYYQMYVHHIATIGLVAASWMCGYLRIGVLVLFIHDTSDVPLDLVKITNYLKIQGSRGLFVTELIFVGNLVTWAYFRLFLYPTKCLYSALMESPIEINVSPEDFAAMSLSDKISTSLSMPGHTLSNILLNVLLGLHIFWYYLLLRILYKLIVGKKAHKVGEEEYEGQSTDNDE